MLKTRIKASQINNLTDARYFAAWGVDWLGFDLNEGSENYVNPDQIHAIKSWIEGPHIVGELALGDPNLVNQLSKELGIDHLQLGHFVTSTDMPAFQASSLIKEVVLENKAQLKILDPIFSIQQNLVTCFLLDCTKNNISWEDIRAETALLEMLQQLCKDYKLILSINLSAAIIDELLESLNVYGLSIKGGEEEKVGVKSFDELDDIFEALETY